MWLSLCGAGALARVVFQEQVTINTTTTHVGAGALACPAERSSASS